MCRRNKLVILEIHGVPLLILCRELATDSNASDWPLLGRVYLMEAVMITNWNTDCRVLHHVDVEELFRRLLEH